MNTTLERLKVLFETVMPDVDVNEITEDTHLLTDLWLDSLNMMLLAIVIEDDFRICFQEGFTPGTVGALCAYIEHMQQEPQT